MVAAVFYVLILQYLGCLPLAFGNSTLPFNLTLKACGASLGCQRNPTGCNPISECTSVVTWRYMSAADQVEIQLYVDLSDAWVGLGLSTDKEMNDDSVTMCLNVDGEVSTLQTYNSDKSNNKLDNEQFGLQLLEGYIESDTFLYCKLRRARMAASNGSQSDQTRFFDAGNEYYLLLGDGEVSSGTPGYHGDDTPVASSSKVRLTEISDAVSTNTGRDLDLVRIHAAFMILAWMGFINITIPIAYSYRKLLTATLFGKQAWFTIHAAFNGLAALLTVIATILIFTYVGGYSETPTGSKSFLVLHPIFGILVTLMGVLNPIMAIFRPSPGDPNRYIFNYAHGSVGFLSQILADINIIFGLEFTVSETFVDSHIKNLIISIIVLNALFHIYLMAMSGTGLQLDRLQFKVLILYFYSSVNVILVITVCVMILS